MARSPGSTRPPRSCQHRLTLLDRRLATSPPEPPDLGDRPLQHALPVLHAGGGVRLAAAGIDPDVRGDRPTGRHLRGLGVHKIRLTGGEPLLRHDLPALVRLLAGTTGIDDLALTTNGILLARDAAALRAAGLRRVTVSLDTLRPERMLAFARSARHGDVLEGIAAARAGRLRARQAQHGRDPRLQRRRGVDLLEFARAHGAELAVHRVHGRGRRHAVVHGRRWSSQREILGRSSPTLRRGQARSARTTGRRRSGSGCPDGTGSGSSPRPPRRSAGPATAPADRGRDLPALSLRRARARPARAAPNRRLGRGDRRRDRGDWRSRTDRGAEERAALADRGVLYQIESLRADPQREMHTRGG